jgi:signal transduction histidine kinase
MESPVTYSPEAIDGASVAIISDDPEFARTLMDRWHAERVEPSFTLLGSEFVDGNCSPDWDLAVVGVTDSARTERVIEAVQKCAAVLVIVDDAALVQKIRTAYPRVMTLRRQDDWIDTAVPVCCEMLRRVQAMARILQLQQTLEQSEQYALLGRYILDMRHSMNNALTCMLGNAELLLLEPGAFSAQFREQIDTIHNMARRLHEIMQRFTSLETEMRFIDSWPRHEPARVTPAAMMMKSSA